MYKIGVVGHSIEDIGVDIGSKVLDTIDLLKFQYKKDELVINLNGNIGIGHMAADACLQLDIKYHLFLPAPVDEFNKFWFLEQQENLNKFFCHAWASTVHGKNVDLVNSNQTLVDNSGFIIAFWNGKKQGATYECVKYCINNNKMVLNGMSNLNLVLRRDI